ncbi:SRPBCC domain-containing protein [Nonomuraea sp. NPDC050536]|uniref:SRPBCC domain-containing protein n=1 Tax=Nonomuraea sp. NPDC050536 TaxID=3364366 RepID=UPI0037C93D16
MTAEPITASIYIEAPPERVFDYLVRPEAIITWMGEYALLDPSPGGRFELDVKGVPVRGRILDLDPPHRLVVSWGYAGSGRLPPGASTVEVRLTPEGAGTRVELQHRDLPADERPGHVSGWSHYLDRLALAAGGHEPGPDPGMPPVSQPSGAISP